MIKKYVAMVLSMLFLLSVISVSGVGVKLDHVQATSATDSIVYNAVVDSNFVGRDGEVVDGVNVYKSVTSALMGAPNERIEPYIIFIKNGTYYESINITKPFINLRGESKENAKIIYDAAVSTKQANGLRMRDILDNATLTVAAANCTLENLTLANSHVKAAGIKTIAMKTENGSRGAIFRNLNILGSYGTIFLSGGTQFYNKCYVTGYDEFIFGAGQAVFDDCDIVSQNAGSAGGHGPQFITNQAFFIYKFARKGMVNTFVWQQG